jgi:hypothetical protein
METAEQSSVLEDDLDLSSLEGLLEEDEVNRRFRHYGCRRWMKSSDLALDMDDETPMDVADSCYCTGG